MINQACNKSIADVKRNFKYRDDFNKLQDFKDFASKSSYEKFQKDIKI